MFNLGPAEILVILVLALVILGPKRLPELARGMGKFFFEFRRQTEDVRGMVEREFYRMDQEVNRPPPELVARTPPEGAVSRTTAVESPQAPEPPPPPPDETPKPS